MKIAMFSRFPQDPNQTRGGIESVTVTLANSLSGISQVDLHVITFEKNLSKVQVDKFGDLTIHRLPGSNWPHMLDIMFGPGHWRLKKYIMELEPDIVHCHEYYGLGLGKLKIPHVFTLHGFDHANIVAENSRLQWLRVPLWQIVEHRGLASQKYIISITQYVHNMIASHTKAKIYDIDNPISKEFFDIRRNEIPGRIFFSGWITPRKNPLTLVRACAKLIHAGLDISLHIAGEESDTAYSQELREEISNSGISEHTVLLGRIGQSEIREELAQACVFVLPSLQENAPMSIAEAMASGLPVICSNRCGMPYMVDDEVTGYVIEPHDIEHIAKILEKLLSEDEYRHKMGSLSRKTAEKRFHPDVVAQKTFSVYQDILSNEKERIFV